MKKRNKIHEIDSTNDLRYRGPLTYQSFKLAGWAFIALSQIPVVMSLGDTIDKNPEGNAQVLRMILSVIGNVAAPLLLIANFAAILSARTGFKKLLIQYGALSVAAIAVFTLIYERYMIGFFASMTSRSEAHTMMNDLFAEDGYLAFNMFLDLFLCTLVMFFLDYRPKKWFQGKKHIIFRLFVLIPILYEGASITLKILAGLHAIRIPPLMFPFLTTKPPMGFVVFVALALFIKRRERKYLKSGKTLEQYKEFLDTNANSWHFSVHAAIIMVVAVIVDLAVVIIFAVVYAASYADPSQMESALYEAIAVITKCGFGTSVALILVAPIMLLFSYNRKPKNPKLDKFIPLVGVGLIAVVYFEGMFEILCSRFAR